MKKLSIFLGVLLLLSCCFSQSHAVLKVTDANGYVYEEVTTDPYKLRIYTLSNGLKVYLSKNTDEPRIQTIIAVRAGSKDEPRDNTGLAHYLEHMMFKGTNKSGTMNWEVEKVFIDSIINLFELHKQAPTQAEKAAIYAQIDATSYEASKYAIANEYDKMIGSLGASGTNAFTSYDLTAYINEIPSNEIERFLKIEYDRFCNLQLRLFHTELEAVYEEFNMNQDGGTFMVWQKIFEGLFKNHPYKTDVIGFPEHLKNPSMIAVNNFHKKYYVPNNMAVIMSGDIDFEKTILLIDNSFGKMQPNAHLDYPTPIVEDPITEHKVYHVTTPDQERIAVAYRFGNPKSKEALYLDLIGEILSNGKAGLIDLDLIQKQKVLSLDAGAESMRDYGVFYFFGTPREGQSLEEVDALIQQEIKKLKAGEFDEALIPAIVNNMKLSTIQVTDSRYGVYDFLNAFINEEEWVNIISKPDEISKITKKEIVDFANNFFKDNNYVTVYKHSGKNNDKISVDKPQITPVVINRDEVSQFAQEVANMITDPIEPVFLDFNTQIQKEELKQGVDFYYTHNENNEIYELNQFVEISNVTDKKLALAFKYLPYLGTSNLTPDELQMEMFKLAMDFEAVATSGRSYVTLFGLNETIERSLALMEEMINDAKVDADAYENLIQDLLKQRSNNKQNKRSILSGGLANYAKYGARSSFTDIISEKELRKIKPQELVDIVKNFNSYQHGFFYYGPTEKDKIAALLRNLKTPENLKGVPARVEYPELPMNQPMVYFANYDMVQAEIMLIAKDKVFDPALMPLQTMFNAYYGGGMNSIIFQEIREARGLAYSAYAYTSNATRGGLSNYVNAYIGTQSDKMTAALDVLTQLLHEMPMSEIAFQQSKEFVINNLRTSRTTKSDIFWTYMWCKDHHIDFDYNETVFKVVDKMTLLDVQNYFNQHIKPAQFTVLVVGSKDRIDFKYLKKIAKVKELPLNKLFGY